MALSNSGAIYRVLAVAALHHDLPCDDEECVVPLATGLDVSFETNGDTTRIILEGEDVTDDIRTEEVGAVASKLLHYPCSRSTTSQTALSTRSGLVADGRDMGTGVFPDAPVKIFLTASAEARAERYSQLKAKGMDVNVRAFYRYQGKRRARYTTCGGSFGTGTRCSSNRFYGLGY